MAIEGKSCTKRYTPELGIVTFSIFSLNILQSELSVIVKENIEVGVPFIFISLFSGS